MARSWWRVDGEYDGRKGYVYFSWDSQDEDDPWGDHLTVVYKDRQVAEIKSASVTGDWGLIVAAFMLGMLADLGSDEARSQLRARRRSQIPCYQQAAIAAEAMSEPAFLFRERVENFREQ